MNAKSFLAIVLAMQLSVGLAAPSAIGIATAKGGFRIDNAAVSGNGTLSSGATVETDRASGQLALRNGARLQLGANSRAKVFEHRLVLEQGAGQFRAGEQSQFNLEAHSPRIIPPDASAVAHVSTVGANRIHVSALRGSFRVTSANGMVVAALAAGRALEFEPSQAGVSAPSKLTGCVVNKDGRFFLTDETSNVTVELRGPDLPQQAGHKVEVTGAQLPGVTLVQPAYLNAGMVVQVSEMKMVSRKCALPAAAVAAAGAGAAGAAAGVSTAVVAGVVVAAAAVAAAIGITVVGEDNESRQ